jgi:hypothetical protein
MAFKLHLLYGAALLSLMGNAYESSVVWHATAGTISSEWQKAHCLVDTLIRVWDEIRMQNQVLPDQKDDYNLLVTGLLMRAQYLAKELIAGNDFSCSHFLPTELREYVQRIIEHIKKEYQHDDAIVLRLLEQLEKSP